MIHLPVLAFIATYVLLFGLIFACWKLFRALEQAALDWRRDMRDFGAFILEVEHVPTWDWWGRFEPWSPASEVADSNDHLYPESAMIPSGGAK